MEFTTLKITGTDALRLLQEYRSRFPVTGQYPFLIGDDEELARIEEAAEFIEKDTATIIRESLDVRITEWIAMRRNDAEEYGYSLYDTEGDWPSEVLEKGSITLHKDVLSGRIKPEVHIGLVKAEQPWHLPAMLKYGGWNECPGPEIHCAFHRAWQEKFGAEITGMSGDVLECTVKNPPRNQEAAIAIAWEQYWYCADIVEQGCGSVSYLAATLLNSPYWYFWWD